MICYLQISSLLKSNFELKISQMAQAMAKLTGKVALITGKKVGWEIVFEVVYLLYIPTGLFSSQKALVPASGLPQLSCSPSWELIWLLAAGTWTIYKKQPISACKTKDRNRHFSFEVTLI